MDCTTALKQLVSTVPGLNVVSKRRYNRRFEKNPYGEQLYRGIFKTYADALASAPSDVSLGYDNEGPAGLYEELQLKIEDYDWPVLFQLEKIAVENATVFDFGGHVGIKYYSYRRHLSRMPQIWTVCDVPAVVARGEELAEEWGETALRFTQHFGRLAGKDTLLCLGSLQYVPEDLSDLLLSVEYEDLPNRVILNTTPFTEEETFYTLNNFGPATAPYKIQNREDFVANVEAVGYRLVQTWSNPGRACEVPFQDERKPFKYLGMMFHKQGQ